MVTVEGTHPPSKSLKICAPKREHLMASCILRVQTLGKARTLDPAEPDDEAAEILGASRCVLGP